MLLFLGFLVSLLLSSAYFITVIALDRATCIIKPFFYKTRIRSRQGHALVIFIWLLSITTGFTTVTYWRSGVEIVTLPCAYTRLVQKSCLIFTLTLGIATPLAIITICYILIFKETRNYFTRFKRNRLSQVKTEELDTKTRITQQLNQKKKKSLSAFVFVAVYWVTNVPSLAGFFMYILCKKDCNWLGSISN